MRNALRAFLALSALFGLMAAPPGTAAPHKGHLSPNDGTLDAGEPCGQEPDDADQVAAIRAMADEECDCDSATNHGKYLHCVAKVAGEAVAEGELREECEDAVVSCASQSTCGIPGAVTCCRTDATGNTTCSIKRSAGACKPPRGGTAFVGSAPSCCDACGAPASSTTTTVRTVTSTTATVGPTTTTVPGATTTTAPGATTTTSPGPSTTLFPTTTTTTAPGATTTTTTTTTTSTTAPGGTTTTVTCVTCTLASTTTTVPGATTTSVPVATTTTLPGSPSGAFLERPEALW